MMGTTTKEVSLWDWNGTLTTIDKFRAWVKDNHPELWQQYYINGENDPDVRRVAKPEILRLFEHATEKGLYPVKLFSNAEARLRQDADSGLVTVVFTSISPEMVRTKARELGIKDLLNEVIGLDEVLGHYGLPMTTIKEDPIVYQCLARYLRGEGSFTGIEKYIDDGLPRVQAALKANLELRAQGELEFRRLYHFDHKAKERVQQREGYSVISDLLEAR
ncbi:hypothetical protein HYX12_03390 [Candidatus Woesearchaeota archaeon]|nr:hypothetical protein [Candidatus Woesearchaeota archaeon]